MRISDWSSDVCSSDLVAPVVDFERVDARFGHAFELNEDMFAQRFEGWPAPVRCLRFEGFERLDREIQTIVRTIFAQQPMARELRSQEGDPDLIDEMLLRSLLSDCHAPSAPPHPAVRQPPRQLHPLP